MTAATYIGKAITGKPTETLEQELSLIANFVASIEKDNTFVGIFNDYYSLSWDLKRTDTEFIKTVLQLLAYARHASGKWVEAWQQYAEYKEENQKGRRAAVSTAELESRAELLLIDARRPIDDEKQFIKTLTDSEKETYEGVRDQMLGGIECAIQQLQLLQEIRAGKVSLNGLIY